MWLNTAWEIFLKRIYSVAWDKTFRNVGVAMEMLKLNVKHA